MKTFPGFLVAASVAASVAAVLAISASAQGSNDGVASPVASPLATSVPGPSLSVDLLSAIAPAATGEVGAYVREMVGKVKRNWKPSAAGPAGEKGESDVVLTILPTGEVSEVHLEGVTRNQALSRDCWDALRRSTFSPLPQSMNSASLQIRVHFVVS